MLLGGFWMETLRKVKIPICLSDLLASNAETIEGNNGDLWDSERVVSDRFNCNRIQRKTTQARKNLLLESKGLG